MIPFDAARSKEGAGYLAGSAVVIAITLGLFVSTVSSVRRQMSYVEAMRGFHQGGREAQGQLKELNESDPYDTSVLLALAAYELRLSAHDEQRLDAAERLYARAFEIDPTLTPALLGKVTVLLRRAELRPRGDARHAVVDEASLVLTGAMDRGHPDVLYMQGAIDALMGELDDAREKLSDESRLPSLPGAGARHWNRAAVAIMSGDGSALEYFLPAYLMRRWEVPKPPAPEETAPGKTLDDASEMLVLAYRVALDPRSKPTGEALLKRCELAKKALSIPMSPGQEAIKGIYQPQARETAWLHNALGLAYFSADQPGAAADAFGQAVGLNRTELLFQRNLAVASYRAGVELEGEERALPLLEAAKRWGELAKALAAGERPAEALEAVVNAVAIAVEAGVAAKYMALLDQHKELYDDEAQFLRDMGALLDHAGNQGCRGFYSKAVQAGHAEAGAMERRIRYWNSRSR